MDADDETEKAKWLLGFAAALLIATFFAWGELKYAAFGTTVQATQGKTELVTQSARRGRTRESRVVNYAFTDKAGQRREGYDAVPDDFAGTPGQPIAVTYRGDAPDGPSRLAGTRWGVLIIWVALLLPTLWFVGGMVRESMQYSREKKARATRRPLRY